MHDSGSPGLRAPTEEFVRTLELRRTRALVERDLTTLEALHAPDYQLITPSGKVLSREAYLSAIEAGPFYSGWEVGDMIIRRSPQMAIVRYKARLCFPSGRVLVCWHTDSYERSAQGWQAVWSQATELANAAGTPE